MLKERQTPVFHPRIFWDVELDHLDYDGKASFVIERVFNRGDVEDIRQCRRYYGEDLVKEVLLDAKFLMEHRMHLAAAVIDEPIESFRCYKLRQSNQAHYPY